MPKQKPPTSRPSHFSSVQVGCAAERKREGESDYGVESGKCSQFKRLNRLHCANNSVRKLRKSEVNTSPFLHSHPLYACHHLWHLKRTLKNFVVVVVVLQRSWKANLSYGKLPQWVELYNQMSFKELLLHYLTICHVSFGQISSDWPCK